MEGRNVKLQVKETVHEDVNWIHVAKTETSNHAFVVTVMNFRSDG